MSDDNQLGPQTPIRVRCDANVPDVYRGEVGQVVRLSEGCINGLPVVEVVMAGGTTSFFHATELEVWRKPWEPCGLEEVKAWPVT